MSIRPYLRCDKTFISSSLKVAKLSLCLSLADYGGSCHFIVEQKSWRHSHDRVWHSSIVLWTMARLIESKPGPLQSCSNSVNSCDANLFYPLTLRVRTMQPFPIYSFLPTPFHIKRQISMPWKDIFTLGSFFRVRLIFACKSKTLQRKVLYLPSLKMLDMPEKIGNSPSSFYCLVNCPITLEDPSNYLGCKPAGFLIIWTALSMNTIVKRHLWRYFTKPKNPTKNSTF
jgi:hypothetical protein